MAAIPQLELCVDLSDDYAVNLTELLQLQTPQMLQQGSATLSCFNDNGYGNLRF